MKCILKISKYILIGFLAIIFLSNFYIMLMSAVNPGTHPDVFGFSSAVVISGSMEPEISVDDMVVIHKQKTYKKDDIIAFTNGRSFVTHRIIDTNDGLFVTKGDANNSADSAPVHPEDISGKVVLVIPAVGQVIYFFKSPLGMMLIILFGFFIITKK